MPPEKAIDPRVTRTLADVSRAAGELLLERGWAAVTHANVAAASGYAKATLYKHWRQTDDLLRAAFLHIGGFDHGEVTGDLRTDLVNEIEAFRRVLMDEKLAVSLIALADRAPSSEAIASVRDDFLDGGQALLRGLLQRAMERGELASRPVGPVADLMSGALVWRIAVLGDPVDRGYVEALIDIVLSGTLPRES